MSRYPFDQPDDAKESFGDEFINRDTEQDIEEFGGKVVDVTSRIKEKAGNVAGKVAQGVDKKRIDAAGGLDRAASVLHDKAGEIPAKVQEVTHKIADGMESVAKYMRESDLDSIKHDVVDTCRKHPAQTLIGALAAGFLVGRILRRR
jgi:hypothetical protein